MERNTGMERNVDTSRSRYSSCITYCDSRLVERRLQDLVKGGVVRFYAMMTHDKDVIANDDGTTEPKKVHTHVVINTSSPMRMKGARDLFANVDGQQNTLATPFDVQYLSANVRYLCHLDNPEKYQYSIDAIITNDIDRLGRALQSFIPSPHDDFMQMLKDVLVMPMAQFASVYGRDGVLNYGKYRSFAIEARNQARAYETLAPVLDSICTDAFNEYELYSILESNTKSVADKQAALWQVFNQKTHYIYTDDRKNYLSLLKGAVK